MRWAAQNLLTNRRQSIPTRRPANLTRFKRVSLGRLHTSNVLLFNKARLPQN